MTADKNQAALDKRLLDLRMQIYEATFDTSVFEISNNKDIKRDKRHSSGV
jgi:hypothetical protein